MKIRLGRYGRDLLLALFLHTGVALLALGSVFIAVDLVEASNQSDDRSTSTELLLVSVLGLFSILPQLLSIAVPIGAFSAIGQRVRRQEILALFAAGARPAFLLRAAAVFGAASATATVINTELVLPRILPSLLLLRSESGRWSPRLARAPIAPRWALAGNRILYVAGRIDPQGGALEEVTLFEPSGGHLTTRTDIGRLRLENGRWQAEASVQRSFSATTSAKISTVRSDRAVEAGLSALNRETLVLFSDLAPPATLTIKELLGITRLLEAGGKNSLHHRIELASRLLFPATLCALAVLAAALALCLPRHQSPALFLGAGAGLGFFIWLLCSSLRTLVVALVPP